MGIIGIVDKTKLDDREKLLKGIMYMTEARDVVCDLKKNRRIREEN